MKDKHSNYEEIAMKGQRKAYEEKFDARFKEWSAEILLLKAEAEAKISDSHERG